MGILQKLVDDENIQGPLETDHYNSLFRLKPGVANRHGTLIQCITFFKDLLLREISTQKNTWQERPSRYTFVTDG